MIELAIGKYWTIGCFETIVENEQQMPDSEKTDTFTEENNLLNHN
jgi:hypothetical protein